MKDPIQAGIAGMIPAGNKLLTLKPDPEFQKTFIPTYKGDSEYGSLLNDYYQSDMFDRDAYFNVSPIQPTISLMNPLFGSMGPGSMGQLGNFNDYLKQQYQRVQSTAPLRIKRSPEDLAKRDLIRKAYDTMGFGNPSEGFPGTSALNPIPQDPGTIQGLLGSGGGAKLPMRPDGSIVRPLPVEGPLDPATGLPITGIMGQEDNRSLEEKMIEMYGSLDNIPHTNLGPSIMDPGGSGTAEMPYKPKPAVDPFNTDFGGSNAPFTPKGPTSAIGGGSGMDMVPDTTDSFGIGSNPVMNNPIAPMPSMPTAPNTQPGHSHDDLLAGIGKLFEQYFPQQRSQQINQPSPMFDAAGNSVPDGQTQSSQVFGNMITPNFGGGY